MRINPLKLSVSRSLVTSALRHFDPSRFRPSTNFPTDPIRRLPGTDRLLQGRETPAMLINPGASLSPRDMGFRASWSKTGDKLVFFRRVRHPQVGMRKTAICIINATARAFRSPVPHKPTEPDLTAKTPPSGIVKIPRAGMPRGREDRRQAREEIALTEGRM